MALLAVSLFGGETDLFRYPAKNSSSHPKNTSLSLADRLVQSIVSVCLASTRLAGGGGREGAYDEELGEA